MRRTLLRRKREKDEQEEEKEKKKENQEDVSDTTIIDTHVGKKYTKHEDRMKLGDSNIVIVR